MSRRPLARGRERLVRGPVGARTSVSRYQRWGATCPDHPDCRKRLRELAKELLDPVCWCGCGEEGDTLDHIIPLSMGGKHCLSNVRWSCRSSNSRRGNRT